MNNKKGEVEMEQKDIKLDDIVFYKKKRAMYSDDYDVYVAFTKGIPQKNKQNNMRISFSFGDRISEIFSGYNYVLFGLAENRIYFKTTLNEIEGFKIQKRGVKKYFQCSITKQEERIFNPFAGKTYNIKHDDNVGLYYIELPEQDY